ncbi:MAG: hypothetical protein CME07_02815 [Gemmatimonadetes bacterium]|nr:hypothetical protein [Gemmatimonadota bacterium]
MVTGRYNEIDLSAVQALPFESRGRKVSVSDFAKPLGESPSVEDLVASLPDVLAARDFRRLLMTLEGTVREGGEWIVMVGGHVVKTGLAPVWVPLLERRWITCLAMNGAAAVHDVEIALFGKTSETVEENLADGSFGMSAETADFLNGAADRAAASGEGLGERLGRELAEESAAPHAESSFLATAWRAGVPATVHVALGTDIVHQHPSANGASIGAASLRDFRILARRIAELEGGVVQNVGSAVLLPEVFLKALTVARNLGHTVESFAAVNFDMIRHYRPRANVVDRPTRDGGWGADFIGHHELLIPLLIAALRNRVEDAPAS